MTSALNPERGTAPSGPLTEAEKPGLKTPEEVEREKERLRRIIEEEKLLIEANHQQFAALAAEVEKLNEESERVAKEAEATIPTKKGSTLSQSPLPPSPPTRTKESSFPSVNSPPKGERLTLSGGEGEWESAKSKERRKYERDAMKAAIQGTLLQIGERNEKIIALGENKERHIRAEEVKAGGRARFEGRITIAVNIIVVLVIVSIVVTVVILKKV